MSSALRCCMVLIGTVLVGPDLAQAQLFRNIFNNCGCQTCQQPCQQCSCTEMRPIVETQYRQQQVVTYRDVQQTEHRQQAYWETVPVATHETVTVDEGSFQKVWVPKLVQKQISKTAYQQKLSYRTVPYQVTRRIPQVSTRLVPQQNVRYVTQQRQIAWNGFGCTNCPPNTASVLPPIISAAPLPSSASAATRSAVRSAQATTTASRTRTARAEPEVASRPVPDPRFVDTPSTNNYEEWTPIESRSDSRTATRDRFGGFEAASPKTPSRPRSSRLAEQRSRYFVPAPTAATVWQSHAGSIRR